MFFYKLLNFFTMTEFWDEPAEKSGKMLAAFLEGQPLGKGGRDPWWRVVLHTLLPVLSYTSPHDGVEEQGKR
jgi:hypothetical protein